MSKIVFGRWVEDSDRSPADARRVTELVSRDTPRRVYRLG
jgi:hypothetical protein